MNNFQFSIFNFQKKHFVFFAILLLAVLLRFYQLGTNPASLDWDEASIGYNAYSLLKTGKDEFGTRWPVSIRSFEDYKPAVYTYFVIPFITIFGLNEFAVRAPSAIIGVITVAVVYLLVGQIIRQQRKFTKFKSRLGLLASLFIAISPWHLQFSRVAFEANVGLFFVLLGMLFCYKGLKGGKWWILSAIFFTISFYSYHSPRLVVPLLLGGFFVLHIKDIWQKKSWAVISLVFGFILLIPLVKEFQQIVARFKSVTVTNQELTITADRRIELDQNNFDIVGSLYHNRILVLSRAVIAGYLDHFNLDFLLLSGDANPRHQAVDMGMLYFWQLPLLLIGIIFLMKTRQYFLLWWVMVAPVAAALTSETPHAVRSLLSLPVYQILAGIGMQMILNLKSQFSNLQRKIGFIFILTIIVLSIFIYFESYYIQTPVESAKSWQYGYKQAVEISQQYENDVDRVIFTFAYDQPHAFVLFYRQIDPAKYQKLWTSGEGDIHKRRIGKYEFRPIDWNSDKNMTNTLFVGTEKELPSDVDGFIKDIHFPDGTIAFRILKR